MLYQSQHNVPALSPSQLQGLLGMIYNNQTGYAQPSIAEPSMADPSMAKAQMMPGNTAGAGMYNAFGGLVTGIHDIFVSAINKAKANAAAQGYGG